MHFKVSTNDYLPPDSTFLKVLKYTLQGLKKITKQHKTYLYVTRTIKLRLHILLPILRLTVVSHAASKAETCAADNK